MSIKSKKDSREKLSWIEKSKSKLGRTSRNRFQFVIRADEGVNHQSVCHALRSQKLMVIYLLLGFPFSSLVYT